MRWFALSALLAALLATLAAYIYSKQASLHTPPTHAKGVTVADYAAKNLPPIVMGTRVIHLLSGLHFDHLLQDTPNELRPPSVILFDGFESCKNRDFSWFDKLAENVLPARERLLIAEYDMDASPKRAWFRFTPEMDLAKRFGVKRCGTLVFVPRSCDGNTEYCVQPRREGDDPDIQRVGCEDFKDACASQVRLLDSPDLERDALDWIMRQVRAEGEPMISPVFGSYREQGRWIHGRDESTNENLLRNYYLAESFPAFTPLGFSASPTPRAFTEWMQAFWERNKHTRRKEIWDAQSSLISFHETPTTFVDLDLEGAARDELANRVLKPLVEKWSGISPLELTAFYGVRIYEDNFLRPHVDRIDTHVLSVTFTLGKLNASNFDQMLTPEQERELEPWPLEVVGFDGEIYRHRHAGGVQIFYESSKLIHGRPYYNRGPPHVGCFMHFKPLNLNSTQAQKWEDIARAARANFHRNHVRKIYKSTPSVEPNTARFTKQRIGDHTGFLKEGEARKLSREREVVFANRLEDREIDLHWVSSPPGQLPVELALQGTLAPRGGQMDVHTFVGHRFAFTERGSREILPKGMVEIEQGKSVVYSYP